jgi:type I restriction enzyme S subunit
VPLHIRHANITQQTARIAINEEVADPHFYSFVLQCNYLQQQIRRIVKSGVQPSINLADVGLLRVPLPSLPVQKAIAGILMTWDRGIRQLTDLIAAKLRFKQGLMQQLLTGKRRFKGFGEPANELGHIPEGWQRLKASELFGNFTQKKNDGEDLLSVTQDRGVIPRTMLEGKVVMPESGTDGYKLVEPGDFVISLRSFQGGLEYSQYRGLVSPAYTVLKPRQTINDAFFRHYFKSYDFIQRLAVAVIGIRDGKQISYSDFESVKLPKPPLDEQRKIAAALDVVDKEVDLLRRQLEALKQQKKGLMQKLLTGEVRVHTGRTENEHAQL